MHSKASASGPMRVYIAAIFLSAALLFSVQPIIAKMTLPLVGGAPAVWTTAMLFFQVVLLAGYVYAHLLATRVAFAWQPWIHGAVLLAGAAVLPVAMPDGWTLDAAAPVTGQVLALLALVVGLPFFALSANAPLLQRWYAASGQKGGADPYFLYAASNIGSIAALLGYPLLVEPRVGTAATGLIWATGYGALVLLLVLCARTVMRAGQGAVAPRADRVPIPARRFWLWAAMAAVPSSFMLSTTQILATDIGSFPLLWVVPLALYLLSFVLAFSRRLTVPDGPRAVVFLVAVILAILILSTDQLNRLGWTGFALMLAAFFAVAVQFHTRLYRDRPEAGALTTFYLALSIGGALGGAFNAVLAPVLFNDVHEAPIVVALAGLALAGRWAPARDVLLGVLLLVAVYGADWMLTRAGIDRGTGFLFVSASTALALVISRSRPVQFCTVAAGLLIAGHLQARIGTVAQTRSFFGVYRVHDSGETGIRYLFHGTTIHGMQMLSDLGQRPRVVSYYHRNGPMGQVIAAAPPTARIGMVGLGVGALACFAKPEQDWVFYEIDPAVDALARDPALFDYMPRCGAAMPTVLGDARVTLERDARRFDILLIDAFSSDAIPTHLLTVEALRIYKARLAPDGVLMFHISNRFFDLGPVLARAANAVGMTAEIQYHEPGMDAVLDRGEVPAIAARLSVRPLPEDPRWRPLIYDGRAPWTDDHASLLGALRVWQDTD